LRSDRPSLVIILGPTGVGKSEAGLFLARTFNGEIINCDSMQVYRGFDIGTDKPTPAMRDEVPHHLLDIADASGQFTAADFVREALAAIRLIQDQERLPFVVGGTGLYLRALLDGLFPGPGRDPTVRRRLEAEAAESGLDSLRKKLEDVDPAYARLVGPRDRVRIIRALEVFVLTKTPISEHFAKTASAVRHFHPLRIGLKLDRPLLYGKIEDRVDRMFRAGLIEEVRNLLAAGIPETSPPFRALGYKHVLRFVRQEIPLEEAVRLTKLDTRHYAKRQMTWFRKTAGVTWFSADELESLSAFLKEKLTV
jgi:tRNA dimethylallyltransferase